MDRREFLRGVAATSAFTALGGNLGCQRVEPLASEDGWRAGEVEHLLPTASHDRFLLKVSFRRPVEDPRLSVEGRSVAGKRTDSSGLFYRFLVDGLKPETAYNLQLLARDATAMTDPWPLRTFPAPDATPSRFRLLSYTCAGGNDYFLHPTRGFIFQPTGIRQRLLARALSFAPDAALALGDHIYWDMRSSPSLGMARSPQAWWNAGRFDRALPILGTRNEKVLRRAAGPQIAELYGTRFRSTPMFFQQDDHDYGENDEATEALRTFPPDPFMVDLAQTTQSLYYPECLSAEGLPQRHLTGEGISSHFGSLRFGRLFEGLLYDCRRFVTNIRDAAPGTRTEHSGFVPLDIERWLLAQTAQSETLYGAHVPSTPILWTAGKWGEWYPDTKDTDGVLRSDVEKPWWPRGWLEQHDRIVSAASARHDRLPLFLSGDLHATAVGAMHRTSDTDLSRNPVVSVLSGTPGSAGPGWPSNFRGQRPTPSNVVEAEEWITPLEENGFTLLDFEPDGMRMSFFRWHPDQGVDAIAGLEAFRTIELPRGRPAAAGRG